MPSDINFNNLDNRDDYKDRIRKRIGRNIRKYRKACNLSQDQLAEQLGCTCGQISFLERGERNPQLYLLYQIAYNLSVSIGELLSISNDSRNVYNDDETLTSGGYLAVDNGADDEDDELRAKKDVLNNLIINCNDQEILDHLIMSLKLFNGKDFDGNSDVNGEVYY